MAFYKLTRDTVSVIRQDAAGVAEAEKRGYVLVGSCDKDGNLTGPVMPEVTGPTPEQVPNPVEKRPKGKK